MNYTKYSGMFKAIVVDVEDPAGYGRVKIRIPSLHGPIDPESVYSSLINNNSDTAHSMWVKDIDLPWAEVCRPYGSDIVPEINHVVGVEFFNGSPESPVIMGWMGYEYTETEDIYTIKS